MFDVCLVSFAESSGGEDGVHQDHDEHQPAAPGDLRGGHPRRLPGAGEPSLGCHAQPAAQVWRLPVQQRHGHVTGDEKVFFPHTALSLRLLFCVSEVVI